MRVDQVCKRRQYEQQERSGTRCTGYHHQWTYRSAWKERVYKGLGKKRS